MHLLQALGLLRASSLFASRNTDVSIVTLHLAVLAVFKFDEEKQEVTSFHQKDPALVQYEYLFWLQFPPLGRRCSPSWGSRLMVPALACLFGVSAGALVMATAAARSPCRCSVGLGGTRAGIHCVFVA